MQDRDIHDNRGTSGSSHEPGRCGVRRSTLGVSNAGPDQPGPACASTPEVCEQFDLLENCIIAKYLNIEENCDVFIKECDIYL
jgi:hypothetical protein